MKKLLKNLVNLKEDTFLSKTRNLVAINENWRHLTVEIGNFYTEKDFINRK